jgi:hypothetical protein
MSTYRFAKLPSNGSVAAAVTLAVSGWLTIAAGTILADAGASGHGADVPQRAVLMEEAAPASPTPLPVAAAAPQAHEKIVVEAQRLATAPVAFQKVVVEARRAKA